MVLSFLSMPLILLYGLSGLVGLAYEVLWVRLETLQFGLSVFGVVVTVSAFMVGLGLGAWGLCHYRVARPWRWLAMLDAAVAGYSLLLPYVSHQETIFLMGWAAPHGVGVWHMSLFLLSLVTLTLPAIPMGASLPLILQGLSDCPVGSQKRLGVLYGVNTLGAVLGALLPLFLLPTLGWRVGLRVVSAMGLLLACGWWWLDRQKSHIPDDKARAVRCVSPVDRRLLMLYGLLGMASLSLEVAWTRLFGLIFLRTEYVLAMILANFLLGMGLGSLVGARCHLGRWERGLPWMAAGAILLGLALFPWMAAWVEAFHGQTLAETLFVQALLLLGLTLPVTFTLGLWFPLLAGKGEVMNGVALYGANALGGAVGALLTGFLGIPLLGTTGTLVLSAWTMALVSITWTGRWSRWQGLGMVLLLGLGVMVWPFPQAARLLPQALAGCQDRYRYEDAVAMTEVVEQPDGQRLLLTDLQRHDASTEPTAAFVQRNQGRLPLLLHPAPGTVLFLGLGTGLSLAGSAPYPQLMRVAVELSQGAIGAVDREFAPLDGGVMRHSQVVRDDARHFLSVSTDHFDVIIGDLYHPDLAGVGALLAREQFMRARAHLSAQGIFVQWLALNQLDASSLHILMRTFRDVFPDARWFLDGMHIALVGPKTTWAGYTALAQGQRRLTVEQQLQASGGEGIWTWLGRYGGKISQTRGPLQTEESPYIEFDLPHQNYRRPALPDLLKELMQQRPSLSQAEQELAIPEEQKTTFARSYRATGTLVQSWLSGMDGRAGEAGRLMRLAFEDNASDRWVAYGFVDTVLSQMEQAPLSSVQKQQVLHKLVARFPWHVDLLRALWHQQRANHETGAAEMTRQQILKESPLDREAQTAKNDGLPALIGSGILK